MTEQTIPVVDLLDWTSGDAERRARFADAVGRSLMDTGFFALVHHGVDASLIARAYATAESFFGLPDETKRSYDLPSLRGQRGFTSFGREHARDSKAGDLKEFWHVGRESDRGPDMPENLWPSEVETFRPVMLQLYAQLETCAFSLLEACAVFLGEPEGLFRDMARGGDSILRVIHYPPIEADRDPAAIRAGAHEDINLITLLCESTDAGLELLERDGTWRPIHALDGQIIVDTGDMMQQLTNGLLRSTTHRVVNPDNARTRRFSMPFFVHPRGEVDLTPLPSCIERTGGERLFRSMTAGEYLLERLREIGLA
jgi:isopenicillin N synthase-like dioxygenase